MQPQHPFLHSSEVSSSIISFPQIYCFHVPSEKDRPIPKFILGFFLHAYTIFMLDCCKAKNWGNIYNFKKYGVLLFFYKKNKCKVFLWLRRNAFLFLRKHWNISLIAHLKILGFNSGKSPVT